MPLRIPYSAEQRKRALALVAAGATQAAAAAEIGCTRRAVGIWLREAGGVERLRGAASAPAAELPPPPSSAGAPGDLVARAMAVPVGDASPWPSIGGDAAPPGVDRYAAAKLLAAVADGLPPELACESIGLAAQTWADWQQLSPGNAALTRWVAVVRIAGANAAQALQRKAVEGLAESRGAMWTLQRLRPEIYDPKPPQESAAAAGGLREVPQETIDAILRARYGAPAPPPAEDCVDLADLGVVVDKGARTQ